MPDPVRVGPWVTGYRGYWYRMFPDQLIACCVAQYGWNVTGPMSIFTGEIIASGPEDGDEGKRRADAAAEAQGWILERDPKTEPHEIPRIVMDPARMTGEPTIGESRFTVRTALGLIAQGYSDAQILDQYDYLTQEGLDAACAWWASPEGMAWALDKIAALLDKEEE